MAGLTDEQRPLLLAVIDRVLPAERFPGAPQDAVVATLERRLAGGDLAGQAEPLARWLAWLDAESFGVFGYDFLSLHAGTRDELLDRLEAENIRTHWTVEPVEFYGQLLEWVAAAYAEATGGGDDGGAGAAKD
jgi:hypothetical protein